MARVTAYGGRVTRTPAFLAALASAAVPGLDPLQVQAVAVKAGHPYEVAFVTDTQHRRWVIRAPLTAAAGAQMDTTVALLGLMSRRLPFSVPAPRGFVAVPEGRAMVYPYLPGRPLNFRTLPAGPGLAAEVGRTVAAVHNVDREVFDEAGLPSYDADEYRTRRLADLDRGAATGHVPTALLARWEAALEDVSLWRFAPTPVHGDLTGDQVLAVFDDDSDAGSGRVRGLTGWEDAKVADPADDFAALIEHASPAAFDSVFEGYAHSRVERPDKHLRRRARLAAELRLLNSLLGATSAGDRELITTCAARLRALDKRTHDDGEEPDTFLPPVRGRTVRPSAPATASPSAPPTASPSAPAGVPASGGENAATAAGQRPRAEASAEPLGSTGSPGSPSPSSPASDPADRSTVAAAVTTELAPAPRDAPGPVADDDPPGGDAAKGSPAGSSPAPD